MRAGASKDEEVLVTPRPWPIGGLSLPADSVVELYGETPLGFAPPLASAP